MTLLPDWARKLDARSRAALVVAQAAEREARHADARAGYERALSRLGGGGPPSAAAALLRWVARTHINEANFEAADDCLEAALATAGAIGDEAGVAHALNVMACSAQFAGRFDDAERLYLDARSHAFASGDRELGAMLEQNLGIIANVRGRLQDALTHYHAGLAGYRALGLDARAGDLANNLGMLYVDLAQWTAAERAFADARASCEKRGDVDALMRVQASLTEMCIARGDMSRARTLCESILEESRRCGGGPWVGEAFKHYGVICREAGELAAAEDHLSRAAELAEVRSDLLLAAETARERAELFARQERNQDMLRQLNRAHRLFDRIRAGRDLADVGRRIERLEDHFLTIVREWSDSIERKDPYTLGHCQRVADIAAALASRVGFDAQELFWMRVGATLHDVGKISVPGDILNKAGRLSPEERTVMERHAEEGAAMLGEIDFPVDVLPMVRHHHERWDGSGYPDRLAGEEIPLAARILCIADVYDALTTTRSYRAAHTPQRALAIMREESGRAFDPRLLKSFVAALTEGFASGQIATPARDRLRLVPDVARRAASSKPAEQGRAPVVAPPGALRPMGSEPVRQATA